MVRDTIERILESLSVKASEEDVEKLCKMVDLGVSILDAIRLMFNIDNIAQRLFPRWTDMSYLRKEIDHINKMASKPYIHPSARPIKGYAKINHWQRIRSNPKLR